MCVEKYTLEHRNLGQAEGAHKVGANARCSQKTTKMLAFCVESEANKRRPKRLRFVSGAKRSVAKQKGPLWKKPLL